MKQILLLVLALMFGNLLKAQENNEHLKEQLPDTSQFEAHCHIEGNHTEETRLIGHFAG